MPTAAKPSMKRVKRVKRVRALIALALGLGILGIASGGAAVAAPGPAVIADDGEGPQFFSGVLVEVSDDVVGDVYAAGQTITISGDVTGDVIAAAQTITITGTVDGDVRLAGQDVTISGQVTRSGTVFAATITLSDAGALGGDLVGAAADVSIGGDIGRDVFLSVNRLSIDGSVGGDVTYYSDNEAAIADGAVAGASERIAPPQRERAELSPWLLFAGWLVGVLYALVALSLVMLLAGLLIPRWLTRVTDHLVPAPWKALLVGFVASITVPLVLVMLLITVVGAPLGLAGLLVWLVLTLATFIYSAFYLGRLIFRGPVHAVVKALVGGLILIVALQIPWLNILVWLAMVFFGLGAQLLEFARQRPWRPDGAPVAEGTAVDPPVVAGHP
ncbi:polymer-forming cytoskeletal protein [Microbacterium sp. Sa4CUA7]|uniref:Polymer-forming cytoskeletal protein n=1 Tax=Microbacterium pullorum TaxID=2762236 RepID=A0ABR8RZK8_9MICO|nr:polymer-forming cytoskeletal protein [Microbacterium pullorum]MBD7956679.1 polymer-forming cytoskeletal protein [Microbacterium pullorum]